MAPQLPRSRAQYGRLHRRIRLTVPVRLVGVEEEEAEVIQNGMTENVSPSGARIMVKTPKESGALLFLDSSAPRFRASVRVVYCEPVAGAQFAVGLHLQGPTVSWTNNVPGKVA